MVPILTPDGLLFSPSPNLKSYLSVYYHRGSGNPNKKSVWRKFITPNDEFDIFCKADEHEWCTPEGHYWGLHNKGKTILGNNGERLCKFPVNLNPSLSWHGFPTTSIDDKINDDLIEVWSQKDLITKHLARKIRRRRA